MTRKVILSATAAMLLVAAFIAGYVTGQVREAAYRYRNATGLAMAIPGMHDMVQSGRWDRKVLVNLAIGEVEREINFLKHPLSIYPHAPQSYEQMPHRIPWLEGAVHDLATSQRYTNMNQVAPPPLIRGRIQSAEQSLPPVSGTRVTPAAYAPAAPGIPER